jgi:signal transduction histidine kinase
VLIRTERAEAATIVDIDDDGDGIPASQRERVFEPFVRLDDSSNGRGAGLGLALVKRIVMQHGGSVEIGDPAVGHTKWTLDDLKRRWRGEGLQLVKRNREVRG